MNQIFAHYYNTVEDGAVNDRWKQTKVPKSKFGLALLKVMLGLSGKLLKMGGDQLELTGVHYDFKTPEYASFPEKKDFKWETCRGLGKSFGYNAAETAADLISYDELLQSFADVVSKNGNMLLGLGPKADGSIPEEQAELMKRLGAFLAVNGEAFFGTRPYDRAEAQTEQDVSIRFTQNDAAVYLMILGIPRSGKITIKDVSFDKDAKITALSNNEPVKWSAAGANIELRLPCIPTEAVTCYKVEGAKAK